MFTNLAIPNWGTTLYEPPLTHIEPPLNHHWTTIEPPLTHH